MLVSYLVQMEYLLRILIAGICGIIIGYERKNRMKEAGIRTHFIVALGSALIMIVSKYGFQDQIGWSNLSIDPSRIAAQVVTGVGFLGAGIIFMQKENIRGLTTAAGIWTTSAIGLTIGSGMYLVGVVTTSMLILGQILFHGKIKWLSSLKTEILILQLINEPEVVLNIQNLLKEQNVTILRLKAVKSNKSINVINLKIVIRVPEWFDTSKLICTLQENPFVKSVEF